MTSLHASLSSCRLFAACRAADSGLPRIILFDPRACSQYDPANRGRYLHRRYLPGLDRRLAHPWCEIVQPERSHNRLPPYRHPDEHRVAAPPAALNATG